jgi:exopolyphosphatase
MTVQYTPVPTDSTSRPQARAHPARRLPIFITRWRTTCVLIFLAIPLSLLLISLVTYLSSSNQYMRPCLPFPIHKISTAAHRTLSCRAINITQSTNTSTGAGKMASEADLMGSKLAGFLQSQKELFFGDLEAGKGKGWTVAVGNEAGGKPPHLV